MADLRWTLDAYITHNEALRRAQDGFQQERDRRYLEVQAEREKALRIKEEADRVALMLAREIQTYKDTKANELREQISSERGLYATKNDLMALAEKLEAQHRPVMDFIATTTGKGAGVTATWALVVSVGVFLTTLIAIGGFVFLRGGTTAVTPASVIYVPAQPGTLVPSPQQPAGK